MRRTPAKQRVAGCVIRGLLHVGRVESIDLIERDQHVIRLCGAGVIDQRVNLHIQDARDPIDGGPWDYAWHDLWSDEDQGEPHLQITHIHLMERLFKRVKRQGAWAMPQQYTRRVEEFCI